ncbi:MAG: acetate kinase [Chitinophagaceae bacterium]|nr:MAG: acetate kinase [Chitinophagaceae bacterium]
MKILVINAGSSSLKFQLFDMPKENPVCAGIADRIGAATSSFTCKIVTEGNEQTIETNNPIPDHTAAVQQILKVLSDPAHPLISDKADIKIVGHRVVHGGEDFTAATVITPAVKEKIRQLFSLAPLHNPVNFRCIELMEKNFPASQQVAVFDTAFHQSMPQRAYRYAIPPDYYQKEHIRVYGFHGISHKYVTSKAREYLQKDNAKLISIHLGNGCSMTAVEGDRSLDTSMGFSPLNGLVMGTRSGEIDPSVIFHLVDKFGFNIKRLDQLLNKESGLLGLCGMNDMRDIRKAIDQGNKDASFACELYAYRVRKYIGAYMAVLNGLDAIIFTAGVGENDVQMRELICSELDFLQISLDKKRNEEKSKQLREINTDNASIKILVVPTNEELEIARQCFEMV